MNGTFIFRPLTLWERIRILFGVEVGCVVWIVDGQWHIAAGLKDTVGNLDISKPGVNITLTNNKT